MATTLEPAVTADPMMEGPEPTEFLDLLLIVTRRKRFLATSIGGAFVLSIAVSLLLPRYYEARTALLPPQNSSTTTNVMAGQMAAMAGLSTRELGIKNPNDLYVGLLGSESVTNQLIERFRLQEVYGVRRVSDARRRLAKLSKISSGKDALITITVEDRDPQRAANIANGYREELEKLSQRLAFTEAGQRRLFFQQQLEKTKQDLLKAETELGDTQRQTGVLEPEANAKALIEGIALVRAQLASKEVEVQSMRRFATATNPDLRLAQEQAQALRTQLAKLEGGKGEGMTGSTASLSSTGREYAAKFREMKYQEALFEQLSKQYEMARLDEAKEGAPVQVVDRATAPDRQSRPRRMMIVAASTLIVAFLAFVAVLLEEAVRRALNVPTRRLKLMELRDSLGLAVTHE